MADEPTAGELSRLLSRLSDEIAGLRGALDRLVRQDVYEAHRAAMMADIQRVEAKAAELEREAEERDRQRELDRSVDARHRETQKAALRNVFIGCAVTAAFGLMVQGAIVLIKVLP